MPLKMDSILQNVFSHARKTKTIQQIVVFESPNSFPGPFRSRLSIAQHGKRFSSPPARSGSHKIPLARLLAVNGSKLDPAILV